jgi:hypothetical protein
MKKVQSSPALSSLFQLTNKKAKRRVWGVKQGPVQSEKTLELDLHCSHTSLDNDFFFSKTELLHLDDPTATTQAFGDGGKGCLRIRTQLSSASRRYGSLKKPEKSVSWGSLEMHSHQVLLGDNPSVSAGYPITIGWKKDASQALSVDDYESGLAGRRSRRELAIPRNVREDWLLELGYSRAELRKAHTDVLKVKRDRKASAEDGRLWEKLRRWTHTMKGHKLDPAKVVAE